MAMASSLFSSSSASSGTSGGNLMSRINAMRQFMGGNPKAAFDQKMRESPEFRHFIERNQGKSLQQVVSDNASALRSKGIDPNMLSQMMG